MTVEPDRPLHKAEKMFASQALFHDYASSPPATTSSDHTLQSDLFGMACSPTMYEPEVMDLPNPMSVTCADMRELTPTEEFDLKPQFECSTDNFLRIDMDSVNASFGDMSRGDPVWSPTDPSMMKTDNMPPLKMEDVFQVDQNDVITSPTLAELNGEDSISIFDDIDSIIGRDLVTVPPGQQNFKSFLNQSLCSLPPDVPPKSTCLSPQSPPGRYSTCTATSPTYTVTSPTATNTDVMANMGPSCKVGSPTSAFNVTAKLSVFPASSHITQPNMPPNTSVVPMTSHFEDNKSTLQQLLAADTSSLSHQSHRSSTHILSQGMSSPLKPTILSAPMTGTKRSMSPQSDDSIDEKWEEIKQFIHNNGLAALTGAVSPPKRSRLDTVNMDDLSVSIKEEPESQDEDGGSDGESDDDMSFDIDSDNDSLGSHTDDGRRNKRFFWQYNTQSKGPKGVRLCKLVDVEDPTVLNNFEDPVFDPELNTMKYKHNGKARRGDGNDITPNPKKLQSIGNELRKLTKYINDLTPVNEMPPTARSRSRKEKNKLASRACRLKKKAQHEANKVKLHGLDKEHATLVAVLSGIKMTMIQRVEGAGSGSAESLTSHLNTLIKKHLKYKIADNTTDFVNSVLHKVNAGDPSGGLED